LLLALALTLLVPALAMGGVAAWRLAVAYRSAAEGRLSDTAGALAAAVDREIAGDLAVLDTLATSPAFGPDRTRPDLPVLYAQARDVADLLNGSVVVSTPDGDQLFTTRRPLDTPLPRLASLDLVERVGATGRPAVGNLVVGSVSGQFNFGMAVPVRNSAGHVVLEVSGFVTSQRMRDLLTAQTLPPGALAALSDGANILVARSDDLHDALVGKSLAEGTIRSFAGGESGLFRGIGQAGVDRFIAFRHIAAAPGWTVIVGQPVATFTAAWRWPLLSLGIGGLGALLIGGILALLLARRIVRPVRQLAGHAHALAGGHGFPAGVTAAALPPAGIVEVEELRVGFAAAEAALRRTGAQLRLFVDRAPAAIAMFDATMRYLAVSRRYMADHGLAGVTPESLLGRSHYEVLPGIPERWREIHRRVLAGETLSAEDDPFPRPDGHTDWVHWEMAPWHTEDGAVGGAMLFSELITARKRAEAALAESEARQRELLATLDLGAFMTRDLDGVIHHWSAGCERLYGWPAAEVVGRRAHDLLATRFPLPLAEIGATLERDGAWSGDLRQRARDGAELIVSAQKLLRQDAEGRRLILETLTDVTAQRAAAAALAESEARLRTLVETVPVGIVMAELPSGRIVGGNSFVEAMLRHPVLSSPDIDSYDEWVSFHADGTRVDGHEYPLARMVLAGEENPSIEVHYQRGDGTRAWMRIMGRPVRDAAGRLIGGVVAVVDTDFEHLAIESVVESEARWRTLAESLPQIVQVRTTDGAIDYRNPRWQEFTGLPLDTAADDLLEYLVHPDDRARVAAYWRGTAVATEPPDIEFRLRHHDGRYRSVLGRTRPMRDAHGQIVRWLDTFSDISEIVAAREMIAREAERLEDLAERRGRALAESEARLAEAARMEALGRLAGGIAHDFNNVLQAIQGRLMLADRKLDSDPAAARRHVELAVRATERGAAVTGRLLAFARRGELRAEPFAPAPLLEGLGDMLGHVLGSGIELRVEADAALPPLYADRGQLEAVLVNLANNAHDAMPRGGALSLRAEVPPADASPPGLPPGNFVRISVIDEGEGIPPDVLARVTEPFFTTKPKGKGTGLGLAMARGFAEQSGGTLVIDSTLGKGTAVALWLPQAAQADACAPSGADAADPPPAAAPSVLLAEDQADVREVLALELEERGFAVTEAEHAAAALALFAAGLRPDALVTDLSMPGEHDGIGLIEEARRRWPWLPVVLVTGHAGEAAPERLAAVERGGPFALVRKPAIADVVVERLARVLGRLPVARQ
jgi:PAS domain S-box-containing protein